MPTPTVRPSLPDHGRWLHQDPTWDRLLDLGTLVVEPIGTVPGYWFVYDPAHPEPGLQVAKLMDKHIADLIADGGRVRHRDGTDRLRFEWMREQPGPDWCPAVPTVGGDA